LETNMKLVLSMLVCVFALAGCAVQSTMVPTGGSRADGTVKLSYDFGAFQIPKVNPTQGLAAAKSRCSAWGYTGAEPFGGATKSCVDFSMGSCNAFRVTVEYQCTGNPPHN
jgi:hypothetical protein